MGNGACEIAGKDRAVGCAHQRCSISQSMIHPSQTRAMIARVAAKTSATKPWSETGRRTAEARGHSATSPANSSSGVGRVQFVGASS